MTRSALLLALATLLLWSCSAAFMLRLVELPSPRIVGISFLCGALVCVGHWRQWKVPLRTFLLGTLTFVAYRLTIMQAYKCAPGIETNLVNGIQPLLMVLLAPAILAGYPLRANHLVGTALGFLGAVVAVTGGHIDFELRYLPGYAMSAGAAAIWGIYALLLKRQAPFPSMAVGGFMAAAGLLSLGIDALGAIHGPPAAPMTPAAWVWVVALGVGPTGIAYVTWDAAMKRGDPRIIASIMYLAPLTSTTLISLITHQPLSRSIAAGAVLLTVGATIGSWDTLRAAIFGSAPAAAPPAPAPGPAPAAVEPLRSTSVP
jgi:drug/metabolite transporter (DMT)-like permease